MIVGYFKYFFMAEKPYYWKRPFRAPLELYRCESDNLLMTDNLMGVGHCAGHHLRQPATPTLFELFLIYIGFIS